MRHLPLALLPLLLACPRSAPGPVAEATACLDASIERPTGHRARLDRLVAEHGRTSEGYDAATPPVAVFDFDNTLIRNDIGTASAHHLILTDGLVSPSDWAATSPYLTADAAGALSAACGDGSPGEALPTSTNLDCGAALIGVYLDRRTPAGAPAFDGSHDRLRMKPRSAWWASMLAGQSAAVLQRKVEVAIDEALAAPVGATRSVAGRHGLPAWIRVDERNVDLLHTLQAGGFDVWVVSASPHHVVVPFAARLGVPADHVIGVQTGVDDEGTLTHELADCGGVTGGALMTFREGKRCWINTVVFGDDGPSALQPRAGRRQLFVAGDATTDLEMLLDASELRLVVDRQKPELMCHALAGTGGEWLVQPMFLHPLPRRADPYPCSTTACAARDGGSAPCMAADGAVIPDQVEPGGP